MIQITSDIRKDLQDYDNFSNLLNYAVMQTIKKHYSNLTEQMQYAKIQEILSLVARGELSVISNTPCPLQYPDDQLNGIRGMRDIIRNEMIKNPNIVRDTIAAANIKQYAYTSVIVHKIGGFNYDEQVSYNVTQLATDGSISGAYDQMFNTPDYARSLIKNYCTISYNDDIGLHRSIDSATYSTPQTRYAIEGLIQTENYNYTR